MFNAYGVGMQGDMVVISFPVARLTPAAAVELAAWLVAVSAVSPTGGLPAFHAAYKAVTTS